jgi:hypothetical protein
VTHTFWRFGLSLFLVVACGRKAPTQSGAFTEPGAPSAKDSALRLKPSFVNGPWVEPNPKAGVMNFNGVMVPGLPVSLALSPSGHLALVASHARRSTVFLLNKEGFPKPGEVFSLENVGTCGDRSPLLPVPIHTAPIFFVDENTLGIFGQESLTNENFPLVFEFNVALGQMVRTTEFNETSAQSPITNSWFCGFWKWSSDAKNTAVLSLRKRHSTDQGQEPLAENGSALISKSLGPYRVQNKNSFVAGKWQTSVEVQRHDERLNVVSQFGAHTRWSDAVWDAATNTLWLAVFVTKEPSGTFGHFELYAVE